MTVTMVRLTETQLICRARKSDISTIKNLNVWAGNFTDVSILRTLPDLEIVSLGNSCLTSLADFQYLGKLQELYLRRNNISKLNELCYLQGLTNLKKLLLVDNPIAKEDMYKQTVLRMLPQLEELDSSIVQPEDLEDARRRGLVLTHPSECSYYSETPTFPVQVPSNEELEETLGYENESQCLYQGTSTPGMNNRVVRTSELPHELSTPPLNETENGDLPSPISLHSSPDDVQYLFTIRTDNNSTNNDPVRHSTSNNSTPMVDGETPGSSERHFEDPSYTQYYEKPQYLPVSAPDRSERYLPQKADEYQAYESSYRQWRQYVASMPQRFPFHRRPSRGNPNLLWPILDLIKELDRQSLWIVELEARRLSNELDS